MATITKFLNLSRASILVKNSRLYSSAGKNSCFETLKIDFFMDFELFWINLRFTI